MRTGQWRRLERRAVAGYERDLRAAIDELCARHPVVTDIEVEPVSGRTARIGLDVDARRLVLGPLAPVGLALLLQARRDGGILRLNRVGRYGPYWWLRLSTTAQPVTVLSRALRLSSNDGGAPVTPVPSATRMAWDTLLVIGNDGTVRDKDFENLHPERSVASRPPHPRPSVPGDTGIRFRLDGGCARCRSRPGRRRGRAR